MNELTRRALMVRGAASAAAVVMTPLLVGSGTASAETTIDTFALDPTQGNSCGGSSCASCQACLSHAANKLFRTSAAADAGRAHPGCNCTVVTGQPLTQATVTNMFAQSDMADRRYTQTAQVLNGEVEQREVPLTSGVLSTAVMAGGAAAIWLVSRRRRQSETDIS
ncbi:hypothetical protein BH10ACT2_BH10ACT2_25630 [soil metagenome]